MACRQTAICRRIARALDGLLRDDVGVDRERRHNVLVAQDLGDERDLVSVGEHERRRRCGGSLAHALNGRDAAREPNGLKLVSYVVARKWLTVVALEEPSAECVARA